MEKVLEVRNLTKVYPGTVALDDLSVSFTAGKVHALLGKNGSGKSTLIKIISGAIQPTSGKLYIDDVPLDISNPQEAFHKGIATVYQELSLIPELSIAENIFFGRLPKKNKFTIDYNKACQEASSLLGELGVEISPRLKVSQLNVWQRQLVEIAKAMSFNPHVLLLDEPTSALAQHETEMLFSVVKALRDKGVIIIYISHKLQEIWEIADTVTVIRDGFLVGVKELKDTTNEEIINMMFGDIEIKTLPEGLCMSKEIVLQVKNLTSNSHFKNISFELRKGEILGIAGLLGSGRSELLRAIFGADGYDSGEIIVEGQKYKKPSPANGKKAGLALTPENRKDDGLIQIHSVRENLVLANLREICPRHVLSKKVETEFVQRQIDNLQIKVSTPEVPVMSLSGGNQQKVLVGNWINTKPRILLLDEPSRGIDVNAKQQIFEIVWEQSKLGVSSIIVSSELEELLQTCHRIIVLKNGELSGEIVPSEIEVEGLYSKCMGE